MIQLVTNQVDMPLDFRDTPKEMALLTNQVKLIKNCLQIKLLTHQVGAAQTKKTVPTVSKTKTFSAGVCVAQQNEYDNATGCWINTDDTNAGPKMSTTARDGDASRVQTLLSASGVQFYINYTDKDGRTSPLYAPSKGHAP